jgi:hypothetical protein
MHHHLLHGNLSTSTVLLVLALICFVVSIPPIARIRFNLIALGLALCVLAWLLNSLPPL